MDRGGPRSAQQDDDQIVALDDGRPTIDEGRSTNKDRLLARLRKWHGDQGRPDLAVSPPSTTSIG